MTEKFGLQNVNLSAVFNTCTKHTETATIWGKTGGKMRITGVGQDCTTINTIYMKYYCFSNFNQQMHTIFNAFIIRFIKHHTPTCFGPYWSIITKYLNLIMILIYLLTATGLTHGGSSTIHIYTQIIQRTTQLTTLVGRLFGIRTQSGQTKFNDELTA